MAGSAFHFATVVSVVACRNDDSGAGHWTVMRHAFDVPTGKVIATPGFSAPATPMAPPDHGEPVARAVSPSVSVWEPRVE